MTSHRAKCQADNELWLFEVNRPKNQYICEELFNRIGPLEPDGTYQCICFSSVQVKCGYLVSL